MRRYQLLVLLLLPVLAAMVIWLAWPRSNPTLPVGNEIDSTPIVHESGEPLRPVKPAVNEPAPNPQPEPEPQPAPDPEPELPDMVETATDNYLLGRVFEDGQKGAIAGVEVVLAWKGLNGWETAHAVSDTQGYFRFDNLWAMTNVVVVARHPDFFSPLNYTPLPAYLDAHRSQKVDPSEFPDAVVVPRRHLTTGGFRVDKTLGVGKNQAVLKLSRCIWVSGEVVDEDGAAVEGASVSMNPHPDGVEFTARADNAGAFRIGPFPASSRTLAIGCAAEGFQNARQEIDLTGEVVAGVRLVLQRAISLAFRFVPLEEAPKGEIEAVIEIENRHFSRTLRFTADDMRGVFVGLPPDGRYRIRVLLNHTIVNGPRRYWALGQSDWIAAADWPPELTVHEQAATTVTVVLPEGATVTEEEMRQFVGVVPEWGMIGENSYPLIEVWSKRSIKPGDTRVTLETRLPRFRAYAEIDDELSWASAMVEAKPGQSIELMLKPLTGFVGHVHGKVEGKADGWVVIGTGGSRDVAAKVNQDGSFDTKASDGLFEGHYSVYWQESRDTPYGVEADRIKHKQQVLVTPGRSVEITVEPLE